MNLIRSILFNFAFYLWTAFCTLTTLLTLPLPLKWAYFPQELWAWGTQKLLPIAGICVDIRGRENIPNRPCLLASKHQSAWDTTIFFSITKKAAIIVKKELLWLPIFGWYLTKLQEIPIDRSAGGSALKQMIRAAKQAKAKGRSVIIFPEGTRVAVSQKRKYQPGVYALYSMLDVPAVPVALNSGVFWPRRQFMKKSGTIVIEFLPPLPEGLSKQEFMQKLEAEIEGATERLIKEGQKGKKQ